MVQETSKEKLSSYKKLRLLYEQDINVNHISELLETCHVNDDAEKIKKEMTNRDFDIFGIEEGGIVIGYVQKEDLKTGTCKEFYKKFSATEMISESTPLIQTLFLLEHIDRLFILERNRITKVVTLADLQKPPIRMLLFGLITLLEMHFLRLINSFLANEQWKKYLKKERIDFAKEIFESRKQKNAAIELSDCLQLCDKRDIIVKDDVLRNVLSIQSKSKFRSFFNRLEMLRNFLAHSQEIHTESWPDHIALVREIEELLEICENN